MGLRQFHVGDKTLAVFELDDLCDAATGRVLTGAWVWDSAVVLAEAMTSRLGLEFPLAGKSVLELGAGAGGLPGLTVALLGASRVVLTDVGALVPALRKNVEANGLGDRVEVGELVWGTDESSGGGICGEFDVVVMSDVFFDAEAVAALARTLRGVCRRRRGTRVWAATEVRPWTGECLSELEKEGFGIVECELASGLSGSAEEGGEVMELQTFAVYSLIPPDEEDCHVADGGDVS